MPQYTNLSKSAFSGIKDRHDFESKGRVIGHQTGGITTNDRLMPLYQQDLAQERGKVSPVSGSLFKFPGQ